MTAEQWKARLLAIHAAAIAGDPAPLDLLTGELAEMESILSGRGHLAPLDSTDTHEE